MRFGGESASEPVKAGEFAVDPGCFGRDCRGTRVQQSFVVPANAELLKWWGLASMLIDHCARFLHLAFPGWMWIGRWAFPCFAVALGAQVASRRRLQVAGRLVGAAVLVFPLQWLGSGVPVGSVLATLGLGLFVAWAVACTDGRSAPQWPWVGLCLLPAAFVASLWCEAGPAGVLLVAGVSLCAERGSMCIVGVSALVVGASLLVVAGGAPVALALYAVGIYVASGGVPFPRFKGLFLESYFLQWAAIAAVRLS
jgi:hypothetical protein